MFFLKGKCEQRKWQECQEAGEAARGNMVSWDSGVRLTDSGWQNSSLVVSDHILLNRCRDQKIRSIFAKILLVGFEGSPDVG